MEAVKLSSKNQVVIPKDVRETHNLKPGDKILFVTRRGITYLLPTTGSWVEDLRGLAGRSRYPRGYLKKEHASW